MVWAQVVSPLVAHVVGGVVVGVEVVGLLANRSRCS